MKPALAQPRVPPRECVTASVGQGARSLRDGSTREDELEGVGSNVSAYKGLTSRANFPTPDGRTPPEAPSVRDGGANSQFGSAVHSSSRSCDLTTVTVQSADSEEINSLEGTMYPKLNTVNHAFEHGNARAPEQRLKLALVKTVSAEPIKDLAIETDISWRTLEDMKYGRRLCSLTNAVKIAAARPGSPLAAEMRAMLSGEAEANAPENIQKIIANLQGRGSG